MIQAWFTTSDATTIPARVPGAEVVELAKAVGLSEADLFRIDLPAGATRPGRVCVLVSQDEIGTLYSSVDGNGNPSATLTWQENNTATAQVMTVWLLPPRPLFMVPGGAGVAVVEAVDCRWWWRQTSVNDVIADPQYGAQYGSDGRWLSIAASDLTPAAFVTACQTFLSGIAGTFTIPGGYAPSSALLNRVADLLLTPQCSVAMALDMVLAATGYVLMWDTSANALTLQAIGGDTGILNTWMTSNKRAAVGGMSPTATLAAPAEPLDALWQSIALAQRNQFPANIGVTFPYRTVEGQTLYNNRTDNAATTSLFFPTQREFGYNASVSGGGLRSRASIGSRHIVEPRALVATDTPALDPINPTVVASNGSTAPAWDFTGLVNSIVPLVRQRLTVAFGKTVWGGWARLPLGSFRTTMMRFTLMRKGNDLIPVTFTEADQEDWLLGPHGLQPDDPKDIVLGKGLVHARRLGSGAVQIDAAPPAHRIFAAKITGATQVGENWRWNYSWEEVELDSAGTPSNASAYRRTSAANGTAQNFAERGNITGTRIAPGVLQSDYPDATIMALPICNDTIVMMSESAPSFYPGPFDNSGVPVYCWFSMPNAVKVTCNSNILDNATLDGGTFTGAT
jgi:hypothetical protein